MTADLESTKALCRSVLMCNSYGVLGTRFAKEFEETTGMVLPLKKLNIRSALDLPRIMPDVIKQERNAQGQIVFYVVVNEKTAHIAKMKSKEKTKKPKNRRAAGSKKMFFSSGVGGSSAAPVRSYGPALSRSTGSKPAPSYRPSGSRNGFTAPRFQQNTASAAPSRFHQSQINSANRAMDRTKVNGTMERAKVNGISNSTYNNNNNRSVTSNNTGSNNYKTTPAVNINTTPARMPNRNVPAGVLCDKIKNLMTEFMQGLWSGNLVQEYETFFKEAAEPNLLELVLQMEGTAVRIERPFGQNSNKVILYGIEETSHTPSPPPPAPREQQGSGNSAKPLARASKYPYTYRYVHAPLPWLGIRVDCYVTLAHSPSYFWVQIKSEQLDDLVKITQMIQDNCEDAPPETQGRFYVDELVCGLFTDGSWYRAIVLDVGTRTHSCLDTLDPALFLPNKPTPQFNWREGWQVKLFFVDYGNIEWLALSKLRRKKFPYPPGQAFRCSLGSITATDEWTPEVKETFRNITENSETLAMTVESIKSDKAHYGFKSRLQEYCQKRRIDVATFDKPLNSDAGWKTTCTINHPTKGLKQYSGFYQNKKNDSEASAAQHVIRDWDIQLLDSKEIPAHWVEVQLEEKTTGEHFNKSLVESQIATPKTSIFDMVIPKQPPNHEIPMPKSEMIMSYTVEDSTDDSDSEDSYYSAPEPREQVPLHTNSDPEDVELPEIGDLVLMQITHVQSPINICMILIDGQQGRILQRMEDELTDYMQTNERLITDIQVNMLCAVYCEKIVYRGRILRLLRNNKAEVLMLDYGDTVIYKTNEVFQLEQCYNTLPYQAISCCLFGMENIINAEEMTEYMKSSNTEAGLGLEELKCLTKIKGIINERTLSVEIYSEDDCNLNQEILARDIRNLKPALPKDGELHTVLLTNISNDGILSLQIPGPGIRALGQLMQELMTFYEETPPRASDYIVNPTKGQICCASFVSDGASSWYRALVNRNVNDHQVEVQYVDYGNTAIINKAKLREPTKAVPNISRLPFQACAVRLADLPTNAGCWSPKEVETLKGYVKDQSILAEVVDSSGEFPLVKIYLNNSNNERPKEINQLMSIDQNLFQSNSNDDLSLNFSNISLANPITVLASDIVLDMGAIPKLTVRKEEEAIISHVDSPNSWYFQSRVAHTQFREMGEQMNQFYSTPFEYGQLVFSLQNMCVAYVSRYHGWYRAKVMAKSPDGQHLQCSMVDYGDLQTIPVANVRPLVKRFATLPIQACRACLEGVLPKDGAQKWDDEAKKFFSDATSERMLWVRCIKIEPHSNLLLMQIIDTSSEQDVYIGQVMIERGYAQPAVSS